MSGSDWRWKHAKRAAASLNASASSMATSGSRCYSASTSRYAGGDQRAISETALAEDDSRAVAGRHADHDQGRSNEGIKGIKLPKTKGHHTWTDDEIAQYRAYWPLGTQQRLVMEFALETASRRGEVVRLGPQHVRNGRIRIERTHGSEDVDMPMSPELQAACDAMPKVHLTYIVTAYGKPRSKYGLGNDFAKWATEAGLPARCRLHGLKKGGMRRLAEAGGTAHELMAISGHKTLTEVQRYTADANRKRLADAAMAKRSEQNADYTNSKPRYTNSQRKIMKWADLNEVALPRGSRTPVFAVRGRY